ncbi:MAG: penicillin-binding protein activator LpoB [Bacteroidales bacterium]|jgi:curli biogenesis system outer membrane secretion channel CsgG|nr:penicillin-binding protein activator LpoB [Bacteroidales bacterium]
MTKPDVETVKQSPKISRTIASAQPDAKKGLKRKVAIARFTNETRYGQSFFIDKDDNRIGKQAVDILSAKLLETEKFILLERADLDKINKELSMGNMQPLKNMADYVIVGSITEFGRKDVSDVGIFSRVKKQVVFCKVHVRLVDVYTGQLIYSEDGEGNAFSEAGTVLGVGSRAGYDSSLNDKAIESAISNLSSNIIEKLLDKPWRAYILAYEDGHFIISGGKSQNIKTADLFDVMQEGKKIKNPQTNMEVTLPGKKIGELKVISSLGDSPENEVSLCNLIKGDLSQYINQKDFSTLFIRQP